MDWLTVCLRWTHFSVILPKALNGRYRTQIRCIERKCCRQRCHQYRGGCMFQGACDQACQCVCMRCARRKSCGWRRRYWDAQCFRSLSNCTLPQFDEYKHVICTNPWIQQRTVNHHVQISKHFPKHMRWCAAYPLARWRPINSWTENTATQTETYR